MTVTASASVSESAPSFPLSPPPPTGSASASASASESAVLSTPAAPNDAALAHFAGRLSFETDVSDVHADQHLIGREFVLVDSRSAEAWNQGRIPGALHLAALRLAERAADGSLAQLIPPGTLVVTYCWGPACNGATRAALAFARLGYPVKEMIGGFEYWVREGFAYDSAWGVREPAVDPLVAPADGAACAC